MAAAKFRSKAVEIDAVEYTGVNVHQVAGWIGESAEIVPDQGLFIHTLEGVMRADVGDWIIRGPRGEHYPCKPDVFATKYGPAPAPLEVDVEASLVDVFSYHAPTGDAPARYEAIRASARELVATICRCCPRSADRTAAVRKVREAVMTANAAIALDGRGVLL